MKIPQKQIFSILDGDGQSTDVCDGQTATVIDCNGSESNTAFLSVRQSVHRSQTSSPCKTDRRSTSGTSEPAIIEGKTVVTTLRRRHRVNASSYTGCSSDVTWNVAGVCNGHTKCTVELSDVVVNVNGHRDSTVAAAVSGESPCRGGRGQYLDVGYDCVSKGDNHPSFMVQWFNDRSS